MMSRSLLVVAVVLLLVGGSHAFKAPLRRRPNVPNPRRLATSGDTAKANINGTFIALSPSYSVPQYAFPVSVGTPPQTFYVVPDSGSCYMGVPSGVTQPGYRNKAHQYDPAASSTYKKGSIDRVVLQYGGGGLYANTGIDSWSVGSLTAKDQSFLMVDAVAGSSFTGPSAYWEGIWGLCFPGLYMNASDPFGGPAYFPPLLYSLFNQGQLPSPSFGFYLSDSEDMETAGEIQFGSPDTSRFTGELHYVDVLPMHPTRPEPMNQFGYWLHAVGGLEIDGRTVPACATGKCLAFVDTGGPLINVPLAVARYVVPFLHVNANCSGVELNPVITFQLNGKAFPLGPEDYVYRIPDKETGEMRCELGMNVVGDPTSLTFQIGDTFLRKYYAYFQAGETAYGVGPKIGFAPAVHA